MSSSRNEPILAKTCTICNNTKDIANFGKASNIKDGYKGQCKECRNLEKRLYKAKNKQRAIEVQIEWRKNNPQKISEYNEKYKERINKYYEDNSAKVKKRMKAYIRTEVGRVVQLISRTKRRESQRKSSDGSITHTALNRLIEVQDSKCYHCGKDLEFNVPFEVHLDHYIPLSKGGGHTIDNVVWSCKNCNLRKHATMPKVERNV